MPEQRDSKQDYVRLPWFKLFSREWLQGSLRVQNTLEERGLWADLLAMANESRNRGIIQANVDIAYPHIYLAQTLNVPLRTLERCLKKFAEQKRIEENGTGITILNFNYYQEIGKKERGRPSKIPHNQLPLSEEMRPAPSNIWGDKNANTKVPRRRRKI